MFVRFITAPVVEENTWTPPVGISLLAATLRKEGIPVHCLDLNAGFKYSYKIPRNILGMRPELHGADTLRKNFMPLLQAWTDRALVDNPDLIGLSIFGHGMVVPSLALAREIKTRKPNITIVMGGAFSMPSNKEMIARLLCDGYVDGILFGEGEWVIRQIIEKAGSGDDFASVPGMWTWRNGQTQLSAVLSPGDPNELPIAVFDDYNLKEYHNAWDGFFPIYGSRGCVNRCTFCTFRKCTPRFVQRTNDSIMNEIRRDVEQYGVRSIGFTDNLINGNPSRFKELCRELSSADMGIKIFGSLALMPSVDKEMLDLMEKANFKSTLLAVESPSPRVRKDMGKWNDQKGVLRIVQGCAERNMKPFIYLMHSFPTEREEDFDMLLHFVDGFKPSDLSINAWPFSLAYIQPGSIDMDFVKMFNIKLLDGTMGEYDPLYFFDPEPRWCTEWVNEEIRLIRHQRLMFHLAYWRGSWKQLIGCFFQKIDHAVERTTGWNPGILRSSKRVQRILNIRS